MFKYLLIFLLGLFIYQDVHAQKADTVYFYKKNSGEIVKTKESADYIMAIIHPADTSVQKTVAVNEYYKNGKLKLTENGFVDPNRPGNVIAQGQCVEYYPTGVRKSVENYDKGKLIGDAWYYYHDSKLYAYEKHTDNGGVLLITCNDSTGKALTTNGKGDWLGMDDDISKVTDRGPVDNGLQNGEWHGESGDTVKYMIIYNQGKCVSGIGYDEAGKQYPFVTPEVIAECKSGSLGDFLAKNIRYPKIDKQNNVQGRVVLQFIVELDGSVGDIKVLSEPDESLADEAIRVLSLSKWKPGLSYGIPTRTYFVIPISFTLNNKK